MNIYEPEYLSSFSNYKGINLNTLDTFVIYFSKQDVSYNKTNNSSV